MEKKRKALRIRCDCGGTFGPKQQDIDGIETEAMVCPKCGSVTLTKEQAISLLELQRVLKAVRGGKRKVVRIGNTFGVTFPPALVHQGQRVNIQPLSHNKYVLTFGGR